MLKDVQMSWILCMKFEVHSYLVAYSHYLTKQLFIALFRMISFFRWAHHNSRAWDDTGMGVFVIDHVSPLFEPGLAFREFRATARTHFTS